MDISYLELDAVSWDTGLDFKIRVISSPNQVISWSHWVAVRSFGTIKTPLEFHFSHFI